MRIAIRRDFHSKKEYWRGTSIHFQYSIILATKASMEWILKNYSDQYLIFPSSPNPSSEIHRSKNAIPFSESRKMRATKILRYSRLILILFIDILIYLKVFKEYIEFNETQYRRRHRTENQHQIFEVKLLNFTRSKLEFICINTS